MGEKIFRKIQLKASPSEYGDDQEMIIQSNNAEGSIQREYRPEVDENGDIDPIENGMQNIQSLHQKVDFGTASDKFTNIYELSARLKRIASKTILDDEDIEWKTEEFKRFLKRFETIYKKMTTKAIFGKQW